MESEKPIVSDSAAFEKRLEYELKKAGFTAEPRGSNPVPRYGSIGELPEFKGTAWRAESGYEHARGTTVADIIRFEREELGNEYPGISDELLKELDKYPASDAVWVNRRRKDCLTYLSEGESEEAVGRVPLPKGSKIIAPDYCGGYLVLRGDAMQATEKFDRIIEKGHEDKISMEEASRMAKPRTEGGRPALLERIFGKGTATPLESLKEGEGATKLLPTPPSEGPPLPRFLNAKWPWKE